MSSKKINILTVLAIVGISIAVSSNLATVSAFEYGTIAQEDELTAYHNGELYLNIVMEQGEGKFMTISQFVNELEMVLE